MNQPLAPVVAVVEVRIFQPGDSRQGAARNTDVMSERYIVTEYVKESSKTGTLEDISGRLTVVSVMRVEGPSMRFPPRDDEPFEAGPGSTDLLVELSGWVISVISGRMQCADIERQMKRHGESWLTGYKILLKPSLTLLNS